MKKRKVVAFVLAGTLLLSLAGCGDSSSDTTEGAFEAYYQAVSDDDIVVESGTSFVDSQLLLTAAEGTTQKQVEKLVKKQGGTIVGYISVSNDYQIEFADGKTYEELDAIISNWENNDSVETVSLNYANQFETDSIDYTNDPWIDADNASDTSGSEWSEISPGGNNWWAEAIMMPSVWNMDTEFQTVKVGIYDSMFDTDNEDLDSAFAKVWNAPEDESGHCMVTTLYSTAKQANKETSNYSHGTHVAGLIAAEAENGFGIAGVSQNAQLYGFSFKSTPTETSDVSRWDDLFEIKYSIALMLNEGVKVINFSVGDGELLVAAQHGVEKALTALSECSSSYEKFFRKCLDAGYDFLIVKGAGNENGYNWTTCSVDDNHPYGYMSDNTVTDDTVYDAQYDFLGAIEDETVKAHILIVGAAENHIDYYTTAYFSTVGERVDVYAPGVEILSDLPTNITGIMQGTSMATPIVSGIAALVWGVNPDLSAVQVASIIRASASVSMFDSERVSNIFKTVETTPIVNAYFAVQLALNTSGEGTDAAGTAGIITGMAYFTEADGSLTALSDATVTVTDSEGNTVETVVTSDSNGYSFVLPAGTYTITVELEGYETASKEVSVAASDVLNVDFDMEKELATSVIFEKKYTDTLDSYKQYAVITGITESGEEVWKITTDKYEIYDLEFLREIGIYEDRYYYIEKGAVVAVDFATGKQLWRNGDFNGDGISFAFGDDGTLYLCGYYGPDFYAISKDGKTIEKIDEFSSDCWWPYKVEYKGDTVAVTLEGSYSERETTFYVNLDSYSYYKENTIDGIYDAFYNQILVDAAANTDDNYSCRYALFDLNGDGQYELITNTSTCKADSMYNFYYYYEDYRSYLSSYDSPLVNLGTIDAIHSALYYRNDGSLFRVERYTNEMYIDLIDAFLFSPNKKIQCIEMNNYTEDGKPYGISVDQWFNDNFAPNFTLLSFSSSSDFSALDVVRQ